MFVNRHVPAILASTFLLASCGDAGTPHESPPPVTVLRGGTVYSGADSEPVVADVWLQGESIVAVGDSAGLAADVTLDVSGLAVTPGFIDVHSHAVRENDERSGLYRWPDAENLLRQGVTSVSRGPGGWSPLPLED